LTPLSFLHFKEQEVDMMDENSDRLWKMQNLSYILNRMFSKFYNRSKRLAVDEFIFLFKGRVVPEQIGEETNILAKKYTNDTVPPNTLESVLGKGLTARSTTPIRNTCHSGTPD
jgi:hypothetical protein